MTTALGVLILVAVAAGAIYALFRPHWAIVLVLTLHPLKQLIQSYLPAFAVNSPAFNFLIFGVVVVAVLARLLRRDGALTGYVNPVSIATLLLYGLALFGLAYTPSPESAREMILAGAPYWLMMVILLPLVIVNLDEFRKVAVGFMVIGTIICLLIFLNPSATFYTGRLTVQLGQELGMDRRGNPLVTATMGAQVALAAVLLQPTRASIVFNLLRIAALVAGMGLAILSGSRGNVVLAVLVAIAFYPLARRVADIRQFFLTAGGFVALVSAMYLTFRFFLGRDIGQERRWDLTRWEDPIQGRLEHIGILLEAFAASPVHWMFGLGTNAFSSLVNLHRTYVHNIVAEILGEHGLVGFGLFLFVCFFCFRLGRELWRTYADDPARRAAVATLGAFSVYFLLLYMKQSTLVIAPDNWAMWIVLAKVATFERIVRLRHASEYELDRYPVDYDDVSATDDDGGGAAQPA